MDGGDVKIGMNMAEQDGDIAEPDDPFGISDQRGEIQLIDYVDGPIAATGAKDGADGSIVEHFLKVCCSFAVVAAEDGFSFADGVADLDPEAPAFDLFDSGLDLFQGDVACRASDADAVAGAQVRRGDEGEWRGGGSERRGGREGRFSLERQWGGSFKSREGRARRTKGQD